MRKSSSFIATAVVALVLLIWLTIASPPSPTPLLSALFFGILVVFTDTFGVRLDAGSNPASMLIGVRDTGPGIPVEELPSVFEKFRQATSIEGRRRSTGLGLPFCKLTVEAHSGQIWVES